MPTIELLPNLSGTSGTTGSSSWYYSTAPPSQSVSAMPKPEDLRVRKAKQVASQIINPPASSSPAQTQQRISAADAKRELAISRRIAELEKVNWRDVQIKLDSHFSSE